jgi:peptidoglycan/LPS O-acetylase OafA/YrhL
MSFAADPVSPDAQDPRPHLPLLDGVRGLAVTLVVASHGMRLVPRTGGVDRAAWEVLAAGWIGVDLFFVLSGFLITGILIDAKRPGAVRGHYFLNFYARRMLRILPLYYAFLAVYFYLLPLIPLHVFHSMAIEPDVRPMLWLYVYNFWGAIHQHMHANIGVFWSLCVEQHFYLLWPLIVWTLDRPALKRVCFIVALLSFATRLVVIRWFPVDHAAYLLTPCRFDGLCAGALVAIYLRHPADWRRLVQWSKVLVPVAGFYLLGMAMGQRHFLDSIDFRGLSMPGVDSSVVLSFGLSALAVLFAGLIALCLSTPRAVVVVAGESSTSKSPWHVRVFGNPAVRALGLYSYAIYILHPLVITLTRAALDALGVGFPSSPWLALPARLLAAAFVLAVSTGLGYLSYHLFEKHFLALKRFFPPARRPVATPETAARRMPATPSPALAMPAPATPALRPAARDRREHGRYPDRIREDEPSVVFRDAARASLP